MAKISKLMLAWRKKQSPGAIMKPSTFKSIEKKAAASGADNPEKVAGAAYWKTARAKFANRSK
jgi:hypothetical protein